MTSPAGANVPLGTQLTIYEVAELREQLSRELERADGLVLDAHELREVDSAGVQLLLHVAREARRQHKSLGLRAPTAPLREFLALLHVADELPEVGA